MRQTFRIKTCGVGTMLAIVLLWLTPALAQSSGNHREFCQRANGGLVCQQVTGPGGVPGSAPYERWENGSPARYSGSSDSYSYRYQKPGEIGLPNVLYRFPR